MHARSQVIVPMVVISHLTNGGSESATDELGG